MKKASNYSAKRLGIETEKYVSSAGLMVIMCDFMAASLTTKILIYSYALRNSFINTKKILMKISNSKKTTKQVIHFNCYKLRKKRY